MFFASRFVCLFCFCYPVYKKSPHPKVQRPIIILTVLPIKVCSISNLRSKSAIYPVHLVNLFRKFIRGLMLKHSPLPVVAEC